MAQTATESNVQTLVLTHFTPGEVDEAATSDALRETCSGEITLASDLIEMRMDELL
jgi:ribonuclease BN (tRNA processing enzyme)